MTTKHRKPGEMALLANQQTAEKNFWLNVFSDDWGKTYIPYDTRPAGGHAYEKGTVQLEIEESLSAGLWQLANQSDYSLHVLLMGTILTLIHKYSYTDDITIGTLVYKQDEARAINTVLPVRCTIDRTHSFREVVQKTRATLGTAVKNQRFPMECLPALLGLPQTERLTALFDVMVLLNTIHDEGDAEGHQFPLVFAFHRQAHGLYCTIFYNAALYTSGTVSRIGACLLRLLKDWMQDPGKKVSALSLIERDEWLQQLETDMANAGYPAMATLHSLFEAQAEANADSIALCLNEHQVSYKWLNERANRIAHYIMHRTGNSQNRLVGILMEKSIDCIATILGILKSGAAYVPIDPAQPRDRIKNIIQDAALELVISEKRFIKTLSALQWECDQFNYYLCTDSMNVADEEEPEENRLMDRELWEYIGANAGDDVSAGGWKSSYTGETIPADEMEEYSNNIVKKLSPYLNKSTRILEIGCASGLSMYKLAPMCGFYLGTDLSSTIIEKNQQRIKEEGIPNIHLAVLAAHEIDRAGENNFDIIIMNSVVQHFHGYNYFRKVLKKCLGLLGDNGRLFIGDVMDLDKKDALMREMTAFQQQHIDAGYTTKTDWSEELFFSSSFFEDLVHEFPEMDQLLFSDKIYSIENELTKFRYDLIIELNKKGKQNSRPGSPGKRKVQDDAKTLALQPHYNPPGAANAGNLAYVIYTSGTTGKPKGSLITHANVVRLLFNDRNLFDFTERDVWTMFHTYSFDFSVWEMYGALLMGGRLVIVPYDVSRDTDLFLNWLSRYNVSVLNQTPSAFHALIARQQVQHEQLHLRHVILGGEAIQPVLLKNWKAAHPSVKVINMYGITETTVHVTYKELTVDDLAAEKNNIGKPIPTLRVYVLDGGLQPLPPGAIGEIFVEGAGVALGYLNRVELTSTRFIESPFRKGYKMYRSGDLARCLENGDLEYLGRNDRQVKIRGFRIEPAEIENQLLKHEAIQQVYVQIKTGAQNDRYLVAYYVARESIEPNKLRRYLEARLPDYMIPAFFSPVPSFSLTINGKINLRDLPELVINAHERYVAPTDDIERRLVGIWNGILGNHTEAIGIEDNFFAIGGHSLKATMLVSAIQLEFGIKLPLALIFTSSTIRAIGAAIRMADQKRPKPIPRAAAMPYYALSSSQQRIFILDKLESDSRLYHIPVVLKIEPVADMRRLENAFRKIITRHEILRTAFVLADRQPVQQVKNTVEFVIERIDGAGKTVNELVNSFLRPFDLSKPQLLRVASAVSSDHGQVFIVDMHHIVADGVSLAILQKELAAFYNGNELSRLPIQYKDYAAWQLGYDYPAEYTEFWKEEFSDDIPVLDLPADFHRPPVSSSQGDELLFSIEAAEWQLLNNMARAHNSTPFMVLLSVYTIWLHKLSGQEDIVIGTPVAGREQAELKDLIGCFINTLPIRNQLSGNDSFIDLLLRVRDKVLKVFDHTYPYEKIIELVNAPRSADRNSLFDVMLILQNWHDAAADNGLQMTTVPYERKEAKLDITWEAFETKNGLQCRLEFCTAIFSRQTMERYVGYLRNILHIVLHNGHIKIKDIEILGGPERRLILEEFNNTAAGFPDRITITDIFQQHASASPDRVALVYGDLHLTMSELNKRADELAGMLAGCGVMENSVVAVMMERSPDMMISILGILKAGAAYLPIDPSLPAERINYILNDSNAAIVIKSRMHDAPVVETRTAIYVNEYTGMASNEPVGPAPEHLAYVIYTSGSTGRPKGALITHRSLMNRLHWMQEYFKLEQGDVILQKTPFTFDVSVWELLLWILKGATLVLLEAGREKDAAHIITTIDRYQVSMLHFVPSMLNAFLEYLRNEQSTNRLRSLRYVVASGEALTASIVNKFNDSPGVNGARLYNLYGPTEATVDVTACAMHSLKNIESGKIPIGRPIDNTKLYVVNKNGNLQGVYIPGELWISGTGVGRGYLNKAEQTDERFINDPFDPGQRVYKTGDLAYWDENGNLFFLGRMDRQVKIRGCRIELGEIEYELQTHAAIRQCIVTTIGRSGESASLCAYYTGSVEPAELQQYAIARVPEYMVPAHYIPLHAMPLLHNGKINYNALPSPENKRSATDTGATANAQEQLLIDLWTVVLDRKHITVNDNFFHLGGDSIKSILFQARLAEQGYHVEAMDVFRYPVIKELSTRIKQRSFSSTQEAVVGSLPLAPMQKRFFSLAERETAHHYNQSVMLISGSGFDETAVEKVFSFLQQHHDALRMRFEMDDPGNVVQYNSDPSLPLSLSVFDLRNTPDAAAFDKALNELQASIDLQTGPLMKLGLFHTTEGDFLQIVVHHLVIDAFSWNIILQDADNLFGQLAHGRPFSLPPKTDSFRTWTSHLIEYACSDQLLNELPYWKRNEMQVPSLLGDKPYRDQPWRYGDFDTQRVNLDEDITADLLGPVNRAYNTQINDLLLTALSVSVARVFKIDNMALWMEGHGREEIWPGINIGRTVGWFTALYPAVIGLEHVDELQTQLVTIKDQFNRIPRKGTGYGVLRYITDAAFLKDVRFNMRPEIMFNYLGQVAATNKYKRFSVDFASGQIMANDTIVDYLTEVTAIVVDGRLHIIVNYNRHCFTEESIQQLLHIYKQTLYELAAHCLGCEQAVATPTDFSYKELSFTQLDAISKIFNQEN